MNFINPFLLLFAAAASIPLLLHLFNKQRVKVIEFSTVKYLMSLQKTRMRQIKIRQILLLILRTLALLAIAFAFARPTTEGGYLPALGGKTTTTAVILLDISGSSGAETNSGSFFERGMEKAKAILGNFTEKEKVVVIGFASTILYDSGEPSSDFDRLNDVIKNINPASAEANPSTAFARAFELLKNATDPNLEIYLISDFQGDVWRNFEFDLFRAERMDVKLFVTSTASDDIDNVSAEKVTFPNQIITTGRAFSLQGEVHNQKSSDPAEVLVSLEVNDRKVAQTDLSIPPSGSGKVSFSYTPADAGFLYGNIAIDDDDLLADNHSYFAMRIPSGGKVALISDDDQEAFFVRNALAPSESETVGKDITLLGSLQASTVNLREYDAVIVNAKGRLPQALVFGLTNFVNSGGAVLFMMRPDLDFADFSEKISTPLFGLQALEAPPLAGSATGKYLLNNFDFAHPLFSPYRLFPPDKLPQAEFVGHYKVKESAKSTVLARYSDNAPAVLEAGIGKGKALLFTFSLSEAYSDIAFRPLMVIMLNRSVEYLVSEPLNQREDLVAGSEITRELGPQDARQFVLVAPKGDTTNVSAAIRAGAVVFDLGRLQQTGVYRIVGDGKTVDAFAVNFPGSESAPQYANAETVGEKVAGTKVIVLDYDSNPAESIAAARFGTELWKLFLLFGFIFLLVEMAVAYSARTGEVSTG